ncbi:MAG TPA: glycosyltransferase family 9 protein [Chloroflexota bacterium]
MIPHEWRAARRILAVRLDNLGDVLVTTPALHAIKESLPEASLTLLASPVGAQVGCLDPDVDDVIVYEAPWMDPWQTLPHDSSREQAMIAALRQRRFDAAIIFTSYHQSPLPAAYLCYLADVPLRLAASVAGPGSLLTTRRKHPARPMHEVERGLDLVGAVGLGTAADDLVLALAPAARREAARLLAERGASKRRPLVVVHPGCTMPARTYPWELYAVVIDLLVQRLGAIVVLSGTADERPLVERIHARLDARTRGSVLPLAGALDFPVFCALVGRADLVVTNNTGPMHVAAAVKTRVVALFALTNPPEQWGPWRVPHRLLYQDVHCRLCYCRVCHVGHDCLRGVSAAMVMGAAAELLAEAATDAARVAGARREAGDELRSHFGRGGGAMSADVPALGGPVRRVGVLRALNLGDLVVAVPALRALRAGFPDAEITLIGLPWAAAFARRLRGYVDRFVEFGGHPGIAEVPFEPRRCARFFAAQRAYGYDLAIQMHGSGRTSNAVVAALAARATVGYYEGVPSPHLTLGAPYPRDRHEIARTLGLVRLLGCPDRGTHPAFPLLLADQAEADALLLPLAGDPGPWVGIHAGAAAPARRWPPERFAAVADALAAQHGAAVVLTGGPGEANVAAAVAARIRAPALNLAGRTSVCGLAALIARLDLFVSADTGPMHVAAAVGTPSVAIFGPGDVRGWAPLDMSRHPVVRVPVACSPCGLRECPIDHRCLQWLAPDVVLAAAELLLARGAVACSA